MRFLSVLFLGMVAAQNCSEKLSVDLSDALFTEWTRTYTHQGIRYPEGKYFRHGDKVRGCVCEIKTCVQLCCPDGEVLKNESCVKSGWMLSLDVHEDDSVLERNVDYHVVGRRKCAGVSLKPKEFEEDDYYVQKDGRLYVPGEGFFDILAYCLADSEVHICEKDMEPEYSVFHYHGMMLSIPFLLVTLVIYYLMPDKNNIHTKCQMTYVASLMMAYLFLVVMQLNQALSKTVCVTLASFCLYFFISSFCWMNITCIDIFLTFSGMRGFGLSKKSAQLKRFAFYCLYSYGVPLILVAVILGINFNNDHAAWYHPSLGYDKCWLRAGMPELLYFYGPMGALLACNIILFILTALKIRQINKDTAMLRKGENKKHYESDKQMFSLYFKLLIAMGINWSLEFISWLVDWQLGEKKIPQIFYVTDLCNALYGLLIFYLFVCKKAIWIMLKKRYYVFMGQPQKARALSTKASNYQTSDTEKTNVDESVTTSKV